MCEKSSKPFNSLISEALVRIGWYMQDSDPCISRAHGLLQQVRRDHLYRQQIISGFSSCHLCCETQQNPQRADYPWSSKAAHTFSWARFFQKPFHWRVIYIQKSSQTVNVQLDAFKRVNTPMRPPPRQRHRAPPCWPPQREPLFCLPLPSVSSVWVWTWQKWTHTVRALFCLWFLLLNFYLWDFSRLLRSEVHSSFHCCIQLDDYIIVWKYFSIVLSMDS